MPTKMGTLLEKNVKMIFDLIGFKSKNNIKVSDYEVDVYAKYNGITIIAECKQYEKSNLNIDNLIFQWSGKNKKIKADRVILVLYGIGAENRHRKLAKKEGVIIWDENDIHRFLELSVKEKENALAEILDNLDIKTEGVIKLRKQRQKSWKPDYKRLLKDWECYEHSDDIFFYADGTYIKGDEMSLENSIKSVNKNSLEPIDTIIFPMLIGKDEIEIVEKYNIKCIVCKGIRQKKTGFFSSEPEIGKTKVLILTIDKIKGMINEEQ